MKQVRFDTPRRSDTRLHSYRDLTCESLDCQEPRPLVGPRVLPTAAILPRYPIEHPSIYGDSNLRCGDSGVSFHPVHPGVSKTVLSNTAKRLSEPSVDLELSRVDDSSLNGDMRRHSADSHKNLPVPNLNKSNNIPNQFPKTLKRAQYADIQKTFQMDPRFDRSGCVENDEMLLPKQQITSFAVPNWPSSKLVLQMENSSKQLQTTHIMNPMPIPCRNTGTTKHCSHNCLPKYNKENACPPAGVSTHAHIHRPRPFGSSCCNPSLRLEEDILEPPLYSPWKEQPSCHHAPAVQCHAHHSHPNGASPKQLTQRQSFKNHFCPHPGITAHSAKPKFDGIDKFNEFQNKAASNSELEKQTNMSNDRREPTVSDLFNIIQIQNEQLKLLQDRVDKLLSASEPKLMDTSTPFRPVQNYVQERVSVETVDENRHKISIGVMTSFEVRTNKERALRTSQMQCNRSQVSIREVISNAGEGNLNFLDGIAPVDQNNICDDESKAEELICGAPDYRISLDNEEKTMNELSLCNLQLDNATTPQLSPDQTIYLDVKDYSDSEDEESGVGWTYYNKVMNHVNEILQESAVPSSAGALHRRAVAAAAGPGWGGVVGAPRCTRLHVDRTDLSITTSKRVTFGGPLPTEGHKQLAQPVSSDISIQMNRLAAKYLSHRPPKSKRYVPKARDAPLDMSLATQRYMEKHNLIEDGVPASPRAALVPNNILDITHLKQQPKLM